MANLSQHLNMSDFFLKIQCPRQYQSRRPRIGWPVRPAVRYGCLMVGGRGSPPVTARWIAAAPALPLLTDSAAQVAERLVLLLHFGVDWSDKNWVGARRGEYWDSLLPSRVRLATYSSASLHQWWSAASARLGSTPRTNEQRDELAVLLTSEPRPVLRVMRDQTTALTLRTRIVADAVRASRVADGGGQ
ncbi:hypothetical protein OG921_23960 [Aldersonia sp. NBC_00410]|uniref:hypothetical protein n=1 Tax=Aldersonia sp. NBC_00410 TaxID=2975954 RepID=UPI00225B7159|nr:hypothetical protein [Aldersonia sp. NBC_00410]MCX5046231.1 hypothetical protein [Aldersonia sp. NBC_00410]